MPNIAITDITTKAQYDACHKKLGIVTSNHWDIKNTIKNYPIFYCEDHLHSDFFNYSVQFNLKDYKTYTVRNFLGVPISFKPLY